VGHWTLDNASVNAVFMKELAKLLQDRGVDFDAVDNRIMCFPHIINICSTHVIKSFHTNSVDDEIETVDDDFETVFDVEPPPPPQTIPQNKPTRKQLSATPLGFVVPPSERSVRRVHDAISLKRLSVMATRKDGSVHLRIPMKSSKFPRSSSSMMSGPGGTQSSK
jgi:hypothetical protein